MRAVLQLFVTFIFLCALGCGGGEGSSSSPPPTFTIGGTVAGLAAGTSVILKNNGGDSLTVSANGSFTFSTAVVSSSAYNVTVGTQPLKQLCTINAGAGTIQSANVNNVSVVCVPVYTVSGTVVNLIAGNSLVVQNNGGDDIAINSNSSFTFSTQLVSGSNYNVTIKAQAVNQRCYVKAGTGVVGSSDISNVIVRCPLVERLWSFGVGEDGNFPQAALIKASNGSFYGTTEFAGPNGWGAIYKFTPQASEMVLASFTGGTDGDRPRSGVIQGSDGNFYGTTSAGGTYALGTVFKLTPQGVLSVLTNFGAVNDGYQPVGGLIEGSDGNLYGTTSGGGLHLGGTMFKISKSGTRTTLWNFGSTSDGSNPISILAKGSDGAFYGTTSLGGTNGYGTVFKITPAGVETVLRRFNFSDGSSPNAGLTKGADGSFYGTTVAGGSVGGGTFFRITELGQHTVLWNFGDGSDGSFVNAGVVLGGDGQFYGTTTGGGRHGLGTIYKVTAAGVETILWDFANEGFSTKFELIEGDDGYFYGVTSGGGSADGGTIIRLIP
jgi:uncharacterized repeat protein (TIGR03803 family)